MTAVKAADTQDRHDGGLGRLTSTGRIVLARRRRLLGPARSCRWRTAVRHRRTARPLPAPPSAPRTPVAPCGAVEPQGCRHGLNTRRRRLEYLSSCTMQELPPRYDRYSAAEAMSRRLRAHRLIDLTDAPHLHRCRCRSLRPAYMQRRTSAARKMRIPAAASRTSGETSAPGAASSAPTCKLDRCGRFVETGCTNSFGRFQRRIIMSVV